MIKTNDITCEIQANSIYSDSTAKMVFSSQSEFAVLTDSFEVVNVYKGCIAENEILSIEKDGRYSVEIDVSRFFKELDTSSSQKCKVATYGMRFYPFVSSGIVRKINSRNGKIKTINISLPDDYRLTWYKSEIASNGQKANLSHSYSADKSNYIFDFDTTDGISETINLNLSVRLGGSKLFKMLQFSLYYWFVTLVGIGVVATQGDFRVLMLAVVTAWVFMFKQFGNANVPQKNTFLLRAYMYFGFLTLAFALTAKLVVFMFTNYLLVEPAALAMATILLYVGVIYGALKSIRVFELTGRLPKIIENYWVKKMCVSDKEQQKTTK